MSTILFGSEIVRFISENMSISSNTVYNSCVMSLVGY